MTLHSSVLDDNKFYERLAHEYTIMLNEDPSFHCPNGDLQKYRGVIAGAGSYEGGYFKIEIDIPREFPFEPPKVIWHTRIWHPNITDTEPAKVCQSILNKDWTPSLNVFAVIETLRSLLAFPNPDDPLNRDAADQMKKNPKKYGEKLKKFLGEYATPEKAFW